MGKMKKIRYMLDNNFSEDRIAWFIFCNGNAGGWHKCKLVAREMRENYEIERRNIEEEE
jgi:hypothetical protein